MESAKSAPDAQGPEVKPVKPRGCRWRRCILVAALVILIALIAIELYARFVKGLGDPPLLMDDPQIEYLYKPSRTYHRHGNTIAINSWSMRSDEFPAHKKTGDEFRVLVLGDSVVYGGAQLDQRDLATEVLKRKLAEHFQRPVVVGNIAAGSWGPTNQLAYVQQFGLFDADVVIIVLNSDDCGDVPAPLPRSPITPQRKPVLAIQELFIDHGLDLARFYLSGDAQPPPVAPSKDDIDRSLFDLGQLIDLINASGAKPLVALWWQYDEVMAVKSRPGLLTLRRAAEKRNVPVIAFHAAIAKVLGADKSVYRDHVHPKPLGQEIMADGFFKWIMEMPNNH